MAELKSVLAVLSMAPADRTKADIALVVSHFRRNLSEFFESLAHNDDVRAEVMADVAAHMETRSYPPMHPIIRQGSIGSHYYLILRGEARVYMKEGFTEPKGGGESDRRSPASGHSSSRRHASGGEDIDSSIRRRDSMLRRYGEFVKTIRAGQGFGEMALISKDGRATASVLSNGGGGVSVELDTEVGVIDAETYNRCIRNVHASAYVLDRKVSFLRKLRIFADWPQRRLTHLSYYLTTRDVPARNYVYRHGEDANNIYFIARGEVKIVAPLHISTAVRAFRMTKPAAASSSSSGSSGAAGRSSSGSAAGGSSASGLADTGGGGAAGGDDAAVGLEATLHSTATRAAAAAVVSGGRQPELAAASGPVVRQKTKVELELLGAFRMFGVVDLLHGRKIHGSDAIACTATRLFVLPARVFRALSRARDALVNASMAAIKRQGLAQLAWMQKRVEFAMQHPRIHIKITKKIQLMSMECMLCGQSGHSELSRHCPKHAEAMEELARQRSEKAADSKHGVALTSRQQQQRQRQQAKRRRRETKRQQGRTRWQRRRHAGGSEDDDDSSEEEEQSTTITRRRHAFVKHGRERSQLSTRLTRASLARMMESHSKPLPPPVGVPRKLGGRRKRYVDGLQARLEAVLAEPDKEEEVRTPVKVAPPVRKPAPSTSSSTWRHISLPGIVEEKVEEDAVAPTARAPAKRYHGRSIIVATRPVRHRRMMSFTPHFAKAQAASSWARRHATTCDLCGSIDHKTSACDYLTLGIASKRRGSLALPSATLAAGGAAGPATRAAAAAAAGTAAATTGGLPRLA